MTSRNDACTMNRASFICQSLRSTGSLWCHRFMKSQIRCVCFDPQYQLSVSNKYFPTHQKSLKFVRCRHKFITSDTWYHDMNLVHGADWHPASVEQYDVINSRHHSHMTSQTPCVFASGEKRVDVWRHNTNNYRHDWSFCRFCDVNAWHPAHDMIGVHSTPWISRCLKW